MSFGAFCTKFNTFINGFVTWGGLKLEVYRLIGNNRYRPIIGQFADNRYRRLFRPIIGDLLTSGIGRVLRPLQIVGAD